MATAKIATGLRFQNVNQVVNVAASMATERDRHYYIRLVPVVCPSSDDLCGR